jgi:hypothetical protein
MSRRIHVTHLMRYTTLYSIYCTIVLMSSWEYRCEEEDSLWCQRVLAYLASRRIEVERFPDEIAWGRQQLHHHDALVKLLLVSRYVAGTYIEFVLL